MGLALAAAVALLPGCRGGPFDGLGLGGIRNEQLPFSSTAFEVGMVVGGAPVAVALSPLTLLLAGGVEGRAGAALVFAPALPTGIVTGVALAAPFFLLDVLALAVGHARSAAHIPAPRRAPYRPPVAPVEPEAQPAPSPEPRAVAPDTTTRRAPGLLLEVAPAPRCCAAGAGHHVCYCGWPTPEFAPRPDAGAPDGARPCTGCGQALRVEWASCPACGRARP